MATAALKQNKKIYCCDHDITVAVTIGYTTWNNSCHFQEKNNFKTVTGIIM